MKEGQYETAVRHHKSLLEFVDKYSTPVFGALSKKEIDILVLGLMQTLEIVPPNPSIFDLVSALKISRTKAQTLIYELGLRKLGKENLDDQLVDVLFKQPLILKHGDSIYFEIENQVIVDYLREKLKPLGCTIDGSFSTSLVCLSIDALATLMVSLLQESEKEKIQRALVKRGVNFTSIHSVMKGAVLNLVEKYAGQAGATYIEKYAEEDVSTLFKTGVKRFSGYWTDFLKEWKGE